VWDVARACAAIALAAAGTGEAVVGQDVREANGVVSGRILDSASGQPLEGVELGLNRAKILALTDGDGRFRIDPVAPGSHVLWARRIGYRERSDSLLVPAGALLDVTMVLSTEAIELDELVVVVRSRLLERQGFYNRQRQGYGGVFMDRAEIERQSPRATTDLFRNVPGVRVVWGGIYGARVFVNQRVTFQDDGLPGCVPTLWLDGIRSTMGSYDMMRAEEIEGIEVYAGGSAPGKYNNVCGTIVIWTRVPIRR
jgi:hypothetical protein